MTDVSVPPAAAARLAETLQGLLASLGDGASVTFREARPPDSVLTVPGPVAALTFRLTKGIGGVGAWILPGSQGLAVARRLLGEEPGELSAPGPEEEDALRELANQAAGALASGLTGLLGTPVGFEAPEARWIPMGGPGLPEVGPAVVLALQTVLGRLSTETWLVLPRTAFKSAPVVETLPALPEAPAPRNGNGIELLLDIALPVTVELGRTRMVIRDILHLAPGSVLELDKLAGEPVDILINDKSIARGEVVVVDENFGVRLTSIVTPTERVANLQ